MPKPVSHSTRQEVLRLHQSGKSAAEIARGLGISRSTVYRLLEGRGARVPRVVERAAIEAAFDAWAPPAEASIDAAVVAELRPRIARLAGSIFSREPRREPSPKIFTRLARHLRQASQAFEKDRQAFDTWLDGETIQAGRYHMPSYLAELAAAAERLEDFAGGLATPRTVPPSLRRLRSVRRRQPYDPRLLTFLSRLESILCAKIPGLSVRMSIDGSRRVSQAEIRQGLASRDPEVRADAEAERAMARQVDRSRFGMIADSIRDVLEPHLDLTPDAWEDAKRAVNKWKWNWTSRSSLRRRRSVSQ